MVLVLQMKVLRQLVVCWCLKAESGSVAVVVVVARVVLRRTATLAAAPDTTGGPDNEQQGWSRGYPLWLPDLVSPGFAGYATCHAGVLESFEFFTISMIILRATMDHWKEKKNKKIIVRMG